MFTEFVVSQNVGPLYKTQNEKVLIMGMLKKLPLILGNLQLSITMKAWPDSMLPAQFVITSGLAGGGAIWAGRLARSKRSTCLLSRSMNHVHKIYLDVLGVGI